jgi:hypothetical protein
MRTPFSFTYKKGILSPDTRDITMSLSFPRKLMCPPHTHKAWGHGGQVSDLQLRSSASGAEMC